MYRVTGEPRSLRAAEARCTALVLAFGLADIGAATSDSSASVPIEIVNNFPVLSISIGDQEIPVAFDLGGDEPIEITTEALRRITVQPLTETDTWLDAKGTKLEARKFRIPELCIGSHIFRNVSPV